MWPHRIRKRLDEVDRKLREDDMVVRQLADVVLQLRSATHEAEAVLRLLQQEQTVRDLRDSQEGDDPDA